MSPQDKINKAILTSELTQAYSALIDFRQIAHYFGWKGRVGKAEIDKVKAMGLKVFKFDNSNKAPSYVLAADLANFIIVRQG